MGYETELEVRENLKKIRDFKNTKKKSKNIKKDIKEFVLKFGNVMEF